jgi:hypothetical protein
MMMRGDLRGNVLARRRNVSDAGHAFGVGESGIRRLRQESGIIAIFLVTFHRTSQ